MSEERREIKSPTGTEGVIFLLYKEGKFLIVKNIKSRSGFYGHLIFPGGEVEEGEVPEQAAIREVREEFGVNPKEIIFLDTFEDVTLNLGYHRFHAYLVKNFEGEVINNEPDKSVVQWVSFDEAREALKLVSSKYPLSLAQSYISGAVKSRD